MSSIKMLSIEIDGHFHGSSDVPKPWVAEILGPCPKFGLDRKFVQKLNDWKGASAASSGNIYGRVARFPLRDGNLYEVSRLRGSSSKRRVAREFLLIDGGKQKKLEAREVLARVSGDGIAFKLPEQEGRRWIARVVGLGTPKREGFVVTDSERLYLLRDGLYEVVEGESQRFIAATGGGIFRLGSEREASEWLQRNR